MELWFIIQERPKIPMTIASKGSTSVPKMKEKFSQTNHEMGSNIIKLITRSSKEIWNKLVVTYEGTCQVRETKISINMHQYEFLN